MSYKYKHLIKENIVPIGTQEIAIFDSNNNKICEVPFNTIQQPDPAQKKYSFGLVSDCHIASDYAPKKLK